MGRAGAVAAAVVPLGVSLGISVLGAMLLPEGASIVRHSSGATWSKWAAVVGYPLVVGGITAARRWAVAPSATTSRLALAAAAWVVVAAQAWAFATA